ncbi:MAG: xanthine dehydrogenase family protein molybdopterin-binding subunit, partial [Bacteriovoracia bacterium]
WSCGNAVKRAAEDAREQIFDLIERALNKERDQLYLEDMKVKSHVEKDWELSLKDFIIDGIMMEDGTWRGGPVIGRGMFMPEFSSALSDPETGQGGKPNVHYTVGAAAVDLDVDKDTGKIKIHKVVLGVDAGTILNPELVRGQITGGIVQGLATVLYEDMRFSDKGKMLNPNFTDYKIPTALDIPEQIVAITVETPQPDGPFGARGVGEHTMIPCAPMVGNAVKNATGKRIKSMPITPEKIIFSKKDQD